MSFVFLDLLMRIGIGLIVSMVFGLALLKTYDLFQKGLKEGCRVKMWWACTSGIFLFYMIIFLFMRKW